MATKKASEETRPEFLPLAQMTLKAMGCNPKEAIKQEKQVLMGRVFGEASEVKTKTARSGDPYSYLIGEFRSYEGVTKSGFESNKLFLPGGIFEQIEATLNASGGKSVQFAYDIYSVPDEKSSVGYRYSAKQLMKTEASTRLDELTDSLKK
jgi:hypothetical protein